MDQDEFLSKDVLQVAFPLTLLRDGPELLDPNNTESVYEYYLLENLACGLLRDSPNSPLGYAGCIAEDFSQENENTWVFKLRALRWSDGTEVHASEIETWLAGLQNESKRHTQYLRLAKRVCYRHDTRVLTVEFPFPIGKELLHELSLADACIVPSDFKTRGWTKTVGPYFVDRWAKHNNLLLLSANKLSPLYRQGMPKKVRLMSFSDMKEKIPLAFNEISIDIFPVAILTDPSHAKVLTENAAEVFSSHPTTIGFFSFNPNSAAAQNLDTRRRFAQVIEKIRHRIDSKYGTRLQTLVTENQMIPNGFVGRLDRLAPQEGWLSSAENSTLPPLTVRFPEVLRSFDFFCNDFETVFREEGIELKISFSNETDTFKNNEFSALSFFVGNQHDPSGSWSFLFSPQHGSLYPWAAEVSQSYKDLFDGTSHKERYRKFQELHQEVLSKFIAVPIFAGRQRYALSHRVDLSKWNKLNSRMRFYDVDWRE